MNRMLPLLFSSLFLLFSTPQVYAIDLSQDLVGDGEINIPLVVFDTFIRKQPTNGQMVFLQEGYEGLQEIVARLYYDRLIADDAREKKLDADPLYKARIESVVNRELTLIFKEEMDKEPVPDLSDAAHEYYKANPDEFKMPESVRVGHIMIGYKKHSPGEAREIAQAIRKELLDGADFAAVAEERSEDPSAKKNKGDLGWQVAENMVEGFSEAAFALKEKGGYSEVIQSKFGMHVIKLLDRKAAETVPYERVKSAIISKLVSDFRQERWLGYVEKVRAENEVGIEKALLEEYRKERFEQISAPAPQ